MAGIKDVVGLCGSKEFDSEWLRQPRLSPTALSSRNDCDSSVVVLLDLYLSGKEGAQTLSSDGHCVGKLLYSTNTL